MRAPRNLRATVLIAVVVGTLLLLINQLDVLLQRRIGVDLVIKALLT